MNSFIVVLTVFLFSAANLLTSYLYLYPILQGCRFGEKPTQLKDGKLIPGHAAPFRLLVFGDPQLEGSTSLPGDDYSYLPSLRSLRRDLQDAGTGEALAVVRSHVQDLLRIDIPVAFQSWRKQLDLLGNDYYLAHIYRCLSWFTYPTHTAVLGDLLGSQWISDAEFETRGARYWKRIFAGGQRVDDEITGRVLTTTLGDEEWSSRIINVAGNHDIGYGGDMNKDKLARFERVFGRSNWEIRFTLPVEEQLIEPPPELRLVVLNSLNIDRPALDTELQASTYAFINKVAELSKPSNETSSATVLLTHLPLHKREGLCADGPYFKYYPEEHGSGVQEQNHLRPESSVHLLSSIFDMGDELKTVSGWRGRGGIILTGHDHEGCDVYHHLVEETAQWTAEQWEPLNATRHADTPGIREITVRSMMGDFGGNAGMLSAWYDADNSKWEFEYKTCPLGKQHFWWAVHVLDSITVPLCIWVAWRLAKEEPDGKKAGKLKTL